MNRDQVVAEIAALAEELCDPHRHTERVEEWDRNRNRKVRTYVTTQQGLLKQLRDIAAMGLKVGSGCGSGGGKPGSKPPGMFEALARHVYIVVEAGRWCDTVGLPQRDAVEGNIRALVGRAPSLDDQHLARLHKEVRFWRAQAATATGWETPPYTPPVPCPVCSRLGTVRINMAERSAYCTNQDRNMWGDLLCGMSVPPGGVTEDSSLAIYIRQVTGGSPPHASVSSLLERR